MRCTVGRVVESAERDPERGLDRSTESCYRWYTERVKTTQEEGSGRANYPIPPREGSDRPHQCRPPPRERVARPRETGHRHYFRP